MMTSIPLHVLVMLEEQLRELGATYFTAPPIQYRAPILVLKFQRGNAWSLSFLITIRKLLYWHLLGEIVLSRTSSSPAANGRCYFKANPEILEAAAYTSAYTDRVDVLVE